MQSSDYKPGVSGWILDKGVLYINSATIQVGALPADPQLITIEASSWPESSFPTGALEQLKFIQGEIEAIPEKWRDSAEVSTQDESFDRDGSDIRTTLTYKRLETAAEVEERQTKIARARKRVELRHGVCEIYDEFGVLRARLGNLREEAETRADSGQAAPETIEAIREAAKQGALDGYALIKADQSRAAAWSVKLQVNDSGQYVASGVGLPADVQSPPESLDISKPRGHANVASFMETVGAIISETSLAEPQRAGQFAADVREVIASELRPGGLLHRHHSGR